MPYICRNIFFFGFNLLSIFQAINSTTNGCFFSRIIKKDVCLVGHVLRKHEVFSLIECHSRCIQDECCVSVNYKDNVKENCEVNDAKGSEIQQDIVVEKGCVHYEMIDVQKTPFCCSSPCQNNGKCLQSNECQCPSGYSGKYCEQEYGGSREIPGKSCKDIKRHLQTEISKSYWIKADKMATAVQVHCDMVAHGGGWTLVYKYHFTENILSLSNNSVTPIPTWYAPNATATISNTPPLQNSGTYGALDYQFWMMIGSEFWVDSTINNGYICKPSGNGSIVEKKNGEISCTQVKSIVKCLNDTDLPREISWDIAGPSLNGELPIYRYDGSSVTGSRVPTHNPCFKYERSTDSPVYARGTSGEIYLR